MNEDNKYDVAIDYAINDILTKDDPKREDTKRKYNRGEYDYKGGDDKVRKVHDAEKEPSQHPTNRTSEEIDPDLAFLVAMVP